MAVAGTPVEARRGDKNVQGEIKGGQFLCEKKLDKDGLPRLMFCSSKIDSRLLGAPVCFGEPQLPLYR